MLRGMIVTAAIFCLPLAVIAQMSPDEATRQMQGRIAKENAAAGQTDPASTQPSDLTNAEDAALEETIDRQRDEINKLTAQIQQLKDKFAQSQINLREAQAAANAASIVGPNAAPNAPPAAGIDAAIDQHTLIEGMSVAQCIQSLHSGGGPLNHSFFTSNQTYSDPSGEERYRWYVATQVDSEDNVYFKPYFGVFQDEKLVSWHTGETINESMGARP